MKLAVFVSGRGSNLQAILDSHELQNIIEIRAVVSDKPDCQAFKIAEKYSIPVFSLVKPESGSGVNSDKKNYINYQDLLAMLISKKIDLIVLAGFLKLIPDEVIQKFHNKIINIHPALLPSFGGKGMYGMNVHKAVFNSSAKLSGPTIHFVDQTYDTGKIIAQKCVDISDVKSPEEIAEKVLKAEHQLLPFVIKKFAEDKVQIINDRVIILN